MPSPSFLAQTPDNRALATLLVTFNSRIEELERRTVQLGNRITIEGYVISARGNQLIATRTSDKTVRVLADFAKKEQEG